MVVGCGQNGDSNRWSLHCHDEIYFFMLGILTFKSPVASRIAFRAAVAPCSDLAVSQPQGLLWSGLDTLQVQLNSSLTLIN